MRRGNYGRKINSPGQQMNYRSSWIIHTFKSNVLPYPRSRNTEQLITLPVLTLIDALTCPTIVPRPSLTFDCPNPNGNGIDDNPGPDF